MGRKNAGIKTVCENRKARHDYFIHETYEAGIALQGTEVKSLRAGRANLKDSYASIQDGELFVENLHISPYDQGNIFNHDPLRRRKLLMHKAEIVKLFAKTREKGFTL
ncbi:SsrA-binding protein SmpB, partial [Mitsuokella jalaludinii]